MKTAGIYGRWKLQEYRDGGNYRNIGKMETTISYREDGNYNII